MLIVFRNPSFVIMKRFVLFIMIVSLFQIQSSAQNCNWDDFAKDSLFQGNEPGKIGINSKDWLVVATQGRIHYYIDWIWDAFSDFNLPFDYAVCIDEKGDVYAGHYSFGFYHYDIAGSKKNVYNDTNSSLISNDIKMIKQDHLGNFWLSTWGDGVTYWDGDTFMNYTTSDGLCDNFIHDIEFMGENVVFASYNGPLSIYNGTSFTTIPKESSANNLSDIALDKDDHIWAILSNIAAANYYIGKYDGSSWTTYLSPFSKSVTLTDLSFDENNHLWISSVDGVAKFDGFNYRYYDQFDGLMDNTVFHLKISSKNEAWFSTLLGLSRLSGDARIAGQVLSSGLPASMAFVKLYKLNENNVKKLQMVDSVATDVNGFYEFKMVEMGKYMIYAGGEANYAGTYLGNIENWINSSVVDVAFCDSSYDNNSIDLLEFFPIDEGNGYISGKFVSADGTRAGSGPIKDVDVTLKKVPGGVVKVAKTNEFGIFEFDKIDTGAFSIIIDIPGLAQDTIRTVIITDTDTLFNHQDYEVDSTGIHTADYSSIKNNKEVWSSLNVYPNPVTSVIHAFVHIPPALDFDVELINSNGEVILYEKYKSRGENQISLNVQDKPRGVYVLKITSGMFHAIGKIILL